MPGCHLVCNYKFVNFYMFPLSTFTEEESGGIKMISNLFFFSVSCLENKTCSRKKKLKKIIFSKVL